MAKFLKVSVKGDNELAIALGKAVADPNRANKHLRDAVQSFAKARGYALGSTGKFFRLKLRASFKNNDMNWQENAVYHHARYGVVSFKGMIAANKPRYGARRTRKPRKRVLGGRLRNAMFHKADDKTGYLAIGVIPAVMRRYSKRMTPKTKGGWEAAFSSFQTSGVFKNYGGTRGSMRRYLGAIGMPIRAGTQLARKGRPLIEPMARRYPPQTVYAERYRKKLLGKKR